MIFLRCFPSGPALTNTYLISDGKSGLAAIIDPSPGSMAALLGALNEEGLQLERILLTHSHWDHIADVAPLAKKFGVEVWIHAEDAPNLRRPGSDRLVPRVPIEGVEPSHLFVDGEKIEVAGLLFEVIHTPGHTPGGVCFYEKEEGVLFSGDTLFRRSIGNLSLPTAEPERMWPSLARLAQLPPQTRVYPGHGEATTIGNESWLAQAKEVFE